MSSNSTPCIFYARGNCRYGNNCKFYHDQRGTGGGGNYNSNSNYGNNYEQRSYNQTHYHKDNLQEQITSVMKSMSIDMDEWENCGIWAFSTYGPIGGKPSIQGIEDLSQDEIRYATYQNNNVIPAQLQLEERLNFLNNIRNKFRQNTQENQLLIRNLLKWEGSTLNANSSTNAVSPSQFSFTLPAQNNSNFSQTSSSQNPFVTPNNLQNNGFTNAQNPGFLNPQNNLFQNQTPGFLQQPQTSVPFSNLQTQGSSFNNPPNPTNNFQNTQNPTSFQNSPQIGQQTPIFAQNPHNISIFGQNNPTNPALFAQNPQISSNPPIFSQNPPVNSFNLSNFNYSEESELMEEELSSFKAENFTDFVPMNPPPKSLCNP